MGYLLDTNIASDWMRNGQGKAVRHTETVGPENVLTSIVVVTEIRFGIANHPSARLTRRLNDLIAIIPVLDLSAPADAAYAQIRLHLKRTGQPIGANDLFIAAQTVAFDHVLVTDNVREFSECPV